MSRAAPHRFVALDSLRGVLALFVVLFHLPVDSSVRDLPLVMHGYLFVDYFFVLSGFVIAHAYGERLRTGEDAGRFLARRIGRVWPLHAFMLAVFVGYELLRVWVDVDFATPFTGDREPWGIVTNLLLIQALGTHDSQTWNGPAWSVSVEALAYVLFAGVMLFARRRMGVIAVLVCVVGAVIVVSFAPRWMNTTWQFGWARAAYGFFLGVLVHRLWLARPLRPNGWIEAATLIAACAFVWVAAGPWTVLGPLVFAGLVWVFAGDAGRLSRGLSWRPFEWLGERSYSVYMVHMFLVIVLAGFAWRGRWFEGPRIDLGPTRANDLLSIGFLVALVGASALTYRLVEAPARDLVNRWTARKPRQVATGDAPA